MNILHVAYDEKFVMFAAEVFGSCRGATNRVLVFVDDATAPLRHVHPFQGLRVVDRHRYFRSPAVSADLGWCDCLIVHYLGTPGARMILRAPSHVVIVWSGWGGDYYDLLPEREQPMLGPRTVQLLAEPDSIPRPLLKRGGAVLGAIGRTARRVLATELLIRRAIRRVDYFSAPIPEDIEVARRAAGSVMHAEFVQLNYASVERTFAIGPNGLTGDDILVGNSASPTNNHADVFDLLAGIDLRNRRVVVPLSYGDRSYRDAVIRYGRELFADRLVPLVDYMSPSAYSAAVATCALGVMGHRRQQGLGNVLAMVHRGAKVFLDEVSPIYRSLTRQGVAVARLASLRTEGVSALRPLTPYQQSQNRSVVERVWGHSTVVGNAQALLDRLSQPAVSVRA